MYLFLLALHSLIRWFVLLTLLFALFRAWRGHILKIAFTPVDNLARILAAIAAHVQLVIGLWLYFISPIVKYFLHNYSTAVHNRQIRFFGMEHITVMLTAIVVITIGTSMAKRKFTDAAKFKTLAIWLTVGLVLILSSIPWSFSPLISRPLFRGF